MKIYKALRDLFRQRQHHLKVIDDLINELGEAKISNMHLANELLLAKAAITELKEQVRWGGEQAQKRVSDIIGKALTDDMTSNPEQYLPNDPNR